MSHGKLVVLNGTSSSGKTSTARALQDLATDPFILTGLDHFWGQLPRRYFEEKAIRSDGIRSIYRGEGEDRRTIGWEIGPTFRKLLYGLHRAVQKLVEVGNNVIVDYVVFEKELLLDAAACWAELNGVLVGMKPPLEVSEEWERMRGDRDPGQARCAFAATHRPRQV